MNQRQLKHDAFQDFHQDLLNEDLNPLIPLGDDFWEDLGVSEDEWDKALDFIAAEQIM